MRFEWDERKAKSNLAKHGVHVEDAALVFRDRFAVSRQNHHEGPEREERWLTVGTARDIAVLAVAHTRSEEGDEEVIRIISARKATRSEHRDYEQGN